MTAHAGTATRERVGSERLLAALPVVGLFVLAIVVYCWQAWLHVSPWLFSDELQYAQVARSIGEHGEPLRRGAEYWGGGLYPWLTAPLWRLADTETAYDAVRYANAVLMSLAVFPAYGLARMVAGRAASLLAAAASVAIPAFVYSAMVLQEPLAYPYATLGFFAIARALADRTRGWILLAVAVALVAPLIRGELVLLPAMGVASATIVAAQSERARSARAGWRARHWVAAAVLLLLVLAAAQLLYAWQSFEWDVATDSPWKMVRLGLWATGALALGIGVFPFVVGLAMTVLPRSLPRTPQLVAFHAVLVTGLAGFALYTAGKAAYITTVFDTRIVERNIVYVSPLLFAATALFLHTRRIVLPALAGSAALAVYVLTRTPWPLDFRIYADAPSASILSEGHRLYAWSEGYVDRLLVVLVVLSVIAALAPRLLRRREREAIVAVAAAAVLALAWSFTAELAATRGSNIFSRNIRAGIPHPVDWIDRITGGEPVLYVGQQISDPNGVWLMEFWNRSVQRVWSLDGTAPGPGPILTPNLASRDGTLAGDPGYRYAVADQGVNLVGHVLATRGGLRLYRLARPLRLEYSVRGLFTDGWLGSMRPPQSDKVIAHYTRFATPGGRAGTIDVQVSRKGWCSPRDIPGNVLIEVGPLALGIERNGVVDHPTARRAWQVRACGLRTFSIPTPKPPFAVEVTITPTFVPHDLDPSQFERRHLAAQLAFDFHPGSGKS